MSDAVIGTATTAESARRLRVLILAFAADPPCRWAWPDATVFGGGFPSPVVLMVRKPK